MNIELAQLYQKYELSDKEIKYFQSLLTKGKTQEAIDVFVSKYMIDAVQEYNEIVEGFLLEVEQGELPLLEKNKMEKSIVLLGIGLGALIKANFQTLTTDIISPSIFEARNITTAKVKKTILDSTVGEFNATTEKLLSSVEVNTLKNIKNMQKEFIIFNQTTGKTLKGAQLSNAFSVFKTNLKKRYPDYTKLVKGNLLPISEVNQVTRFYQLDKYIEESIRTTLLNIDRVASQVSVTIKEEQKGLAKNRTAVKVVEYYLAEDRILKSGKEREICKHILRDKKYGVPLLALDEETGAALGIMTVDTAMNTLEGAMGPFCRHSVRPVSVATRKRLETILQNKKS